MQVEIVGILYEMAVMGYSVLGSGLFLFPHVNLPL